MSLIPHPAHCDHSNCFVLFSHSTPVKRTNFHAGSNVSVYPGYEVMQDCECDETNCNKNHNWENIQDNLQKMDSLYNSSFCSWLKDEENVTVIGVYLQHIVLDYSIKRATRVIEWLTRGWKIENIVSLVRKITSNWTSQDSDDPKIVSVGDIRKAELVFNLIKGWCINRIAYFTELFIGDWMFDFHKQFFLTCLTSEMDFRTLKEFCGSLESSVVSFSIKLQLLADSGKRESSVFSTLLGKRSLRQAHHSTIRKTLKRPKLVIPTNNSRSGNELLNPPASATVDSFPNELESGSNYLQSNYPQTPRMGTFSANTLTTSVQRFIPLARPPTSTSSSDGSISSNSDNNDKKNNHHNKPVNLESESESQSQSDTMDDSNPYNLLSDDVVSNPSSEISTKRRPSRI